MSPSCTRYERKDTVKSSKQVRPHPTLLVTDSRMLVWKGTLVSSASMLLRLTLVRMVNTVAASPEASMIASTLRGRGSTQGLLSSTCTRMRLKT